MNTSQDELTVIKEKVSVPLIKVAKEALEFREKYINFQLQLVTIAGATFSIYLAFGTSTSSNLTKWGFIFLAISLVFGILSVILKLMHRFWGVYFTAFDAEKRIWGTERSQEFKDLLIEMNYLRPIIYDKNLDEDFLEGTRKTGAIVARRFLENWTNSIASLFGMFQLLAILIATIFLTIGLLQLPVLNLH